MLSKNKLEQQLKKLQEMLVLQGKHVVELKRSQNAIFNTSFTPFTTSTSMINITSLTAQTNDSASQTSNTIQQSQIPHHLLLALNQHINISHAIPHYIV